MSERLGNVLAEGKTKIIHEIPFSNDVFIESKDDITAGDGERHDVMAGKASLATRTTVNCFKLLERAGIATHFIGEEDDTTFRARKVTMVPIELVARRLAFGSYLKRNPDTASETRFNEPVIEFFDKDDGMHDPLLQIDFGRGMVQRYDAKKPISEESLVDERTINGAPQLAIGRWDALKAVTQDVFRVLEVAWANQGVTLVDLKIECGFTDEGELLVADVIDNDSWRIWPGGDSKQMKDKQQFRDQSASMEDLTTDYAWVADATSRFVG